MTPRCYATMCIQSDSPAQHGRSWGRTEPPMFRLFAALLLNHTRLPLYVIHDAPVNPVALLGKAVPPRQLHGAHAQVRPFQVDIIKSRVRSPISQRHYESMYTKLHIWRLPCRQVAYVDYDVLTLRSPDPIFDACGNAAFCAVQARGQGQRYFNGGVFVARPDYATFEKFEHTMRADEARNTVHEYAEQDLLNALYWDWWELPSRYNVQGVGSGRSWDPQSDVWVHEKYWLLPDALRAWLHLPKSLPAPSWFDYIRNFWAHLW